MADGANGLPAEVAGGVGEVAPVSAEAALGVALGPAAPGPAVGDLAAGADGMSALAPSTTPLARGGPLPPLRRGEALKAARPRVAYSDDLAGRIVARVAGGESVPKVCRDPAMPCADTVYEWARREPRFGRALAVAHQAARRAKVRAQRVAAAAKWARRALERRGRPCTYTPELGEEVCRRLVAGETLRSIGADPEMPCAETVFNWVKDVPGFEDRYAQAKAMQADVMFDRAHDEAMAATPGDVWAQKLKVDTLLRMVSRMRPRKYCERVVAEAAIAELRAEDDPDRQGLTVIIKRPEDITPEEYENARLTEEGYFDRPARRRR